MNQLVELFERKKNDVLAVYFTAGFPKLNDTVRIIKSLSEQGVDIIEIGMPFSDPLADGPVIQESSRVALENGMNMKLMFQQLSFLSTTRAGSLPPLVLMGYLNPVLQFGMQNFLDECIKAKVSGVILPDLPLEVYENEFKSLFENANVHFIFLITPGSAEQRVRKIASLSRGFLYLVSTSATTGGSASLSKEQRSALKKVSDYRLGIPILTGFGIHNKETFLEASQHTNGAIIGTAFIKKIHIDASPECIAEFIHGIKN